jgi:hypothetical protein
VGDLGSARTDLGDGVYRAVQQCPHDRVVVLLRHGAVADQVRVSAVVERKVRSVPRGCP